MHPYENTAAVQVQLTRVLVQFCFSTLSLIFFATFFKKCKLDNVKHTAA